MKKLMDAADLAVAESGRHSKKYETMQDLWQACPKLKDASLFFTVTMRALAGVCGNGTLSCGPHLHLRYFDHIYTCAILTTFTPAHRDIML
jgi:hypothetical protein